MLLHLPRAGHARLEMTTLERARLLHEDLEKLMSKLATELNTETRLVRQLIQGGFFERSNDFFILATGACLHRAPSEGRRREIRR